MASEPIRRFGDCAAKSQPNARPLPLLSLEALLGEPVFSPSTLSFVHELGDTETNTTEQVNEKNLTSSYIFSADGAV